MRLKSIQGLEMKAVGKVVTLLILLVLAAQAEPFSYAQSKRAQSKKKTATEATQTESARAKSKQDLIELNKEYKASLKHLLSLLEADVQRASKQAEKLKTLYTDGIISKRELEESEQAVVTARGKVEEIHKQMEAADELLAEYLAEAEETAALMKAAQAKTAQSTVRQTSFIRYAGAGNWQLADASKIQGFFFAKFGRPLPVSAFGQTDLHNRWGYDHRNAMDVGIHPDSPAGQALIAYLRSNGIPFLAFRGAIAGTATGPHIHIGRPSHRIAAH